MISQAYMNQIYSFSAKKSLNNAGDKNETHNKDVRENKEDLTQQSNSKRDKKVRCSLYTLVLGGIIPPVLSRVLEPIVSNEEKIARWSEKITGKTKFVDNIIAKIIPDKTLPSSLKSKSVEYLNSDHLVKFKDGYYSVAGLERPAILAREAAIESGNVKSLKQAEKILKTL
ncbi:MAG: hypothetical protein AB7V50_07975 [Vampirovibrionia bacterium]